MHFCGFWVEMSQGELTGHSMCVCRVLYLMQNSLDFFLFASRFFLFFFFSLKSLFSQKLTFLLLQLFVCAS